ncbi:MAG TPA: Holliday junction branch migration DNA helicase RuvB [Armatimonadota bacterium]|nr:Holliday junction branch migration DNA helicase RuvB [Armatimonadota bacterium]
MAREKIISGEEIVEEPVQTPIESDDENRHIWNLRPRTLDEYIGQANVVENLHIAITAAKNRQEPLEHVLLHGAPGLGKTTLAHIIASEMGASIIATSGPALEKPKDVMGILSSLEVGDVLFIDEIHRLSRVIEEFLYSAMEDFQVDFVLDKGAYAKTIKVPLKRFTLVGATTRAGMLSAPLRDRFGIFVHMDYYSTDELQRIVRRSAGLLKVKTDADGAGEIACRSRGTPRVANRLLRRVRDYAEVEADGVITREIADIALKREMVDQMGLDKLDRAFLRTIIEFYNGGPVGIEALSATLNEETDTLVDMVEPYLLKIGFLNRTPSGRKATRLASEHLGLKPTSNAERPALNFEP